MDKKKGFLNVFISVSFKIVILFSALLTRRFLIHYLGENVNGLNSLFLSIIGFLSVAELGIGTAISFCMYKPIIEHDEKKVGALYQLINKIYIIIGAIIFAAGLSVMPFLSFLVADYSDVNVNIYFTFLLMLISVVITYFYSSKTSLINAYKNNYITTIITSVGTIGQNVLQIVVLIVLHRVIDSLNLLFVLYLTCRIIFSLIQWLFTDLVVYKKYRTVTSIKEKVDLETKEQVKKSVRAMMMHKIGGVLVNSADSIIISAFIGVVVLGKYSNYSTIIVSMTGILYLFFTPLTSVIGHFCLEGSKEEVEKHFKFFYTLNYILGCIFFLGYFAIIDDLIAVIIGKESAILSRTISFVITINYFVQFMRQSVLLFRDATGTFYNDRWKPLVEGLLNIALSILFVLVFPEEYKVVGVIVATIITNLLICHVIEPIVLSKYGLAFSIKKYLIKNYALMAFFALVLVLSNYCFIRFDNSYISILVNGSLAVLLSFVPIAVSIALNRDFFSVLKKLFREKKKIDNSSNNC